MLRSRVLLCILLAGIAGCKTQQKGSTAPPVARRDHPTFRLETDAPVDTMLAVRDLFTSEPLTLEKRGAILVLSTPRGVIDTLTTPALLTKDRPSVRRLDSSFIELLAAPVDTLAAQVTDLVCVADGRLHWSARMPSLLRLPQAPASGVYSTSYTLLRSPLAMRGTELFTPTMTESGAPAPWRYSFELRFDDSTGAFYNVSVALDSVPRAAGGVVTGSHPGIALRTGTSVLIDGWWHTLSVPDDLDADEFARGTVGMVLEGKGEWGDTLRAMR